MYVCNMQQGNMFVRVHARVCINVARPNKQSCNAVWKALDLEPLNKELGSRYCSRVGRSMPEVPELPTPGGLSQKYRETKI